MSNRQPAKVSSGAGGRAKTSRWAWRVPVWALLLVMIVGAFGMLGVGASTRNAQTLTVLAKGSTTCTTSLFGIQNCVQNSAGSGGTGATNKGGGGTTKKGGGGTTKTGGGSTTSSSTSAVCTAFPTLSVCQQQSGRAGAGGGNFNVSSSVTAAGTFTCSVSGVVCYDNYSKNPQDLLPAWRWGGSTQMLKASGSVPDPAAFIFGGLGGLMFALAGWIWQLLLAIIAWALGMNLVNSAATSINRGFSVFFTSLAGPGAAAIWIVIVLGGAYAVRLLMRGKLPKVFSTALIVIVPLAALTALDFAATGNTSGVVSSVTTSSGSAGGSANTGNTKLNGGNATGTATLTGQCAQVNVGSPAWIACKGSNYLDNLAADMSTGFGMWGGSIGATGSAGAPVDAAPTCSAYVATLYSQYYAYSALGGLNPGANTSLTGASTNNSSLDGLATVSNLWQQSLLTNWVDAQYGGGTAGADMYCHEMEESATISATEQKTLMVESASISGTSDFGLSTTYSAIPVGVFANYIITGGYNNNRNAIDQTLAWGACSVSGSGKWTTRDSGWSADFMATDGNAGSGDFAGQCNDWFTNPNPHGTNAGTDDAYGIGGSSGKLPTPATAADINDQNTVAAVLGHDTGKILLDGLLAFITAIIYLFALGGLAIGSVIAQIGLVLLLALLPVTLLLLAIPTKEGGRIQAGVKLMKMTLGFFVAKLSLTLVLLILVELIMLLDNLLVAGGSGLMSNIITAAIPLVCVFLLRKILKAAGMGNIMSLSGAVGMPLAAALTAGGQKGLNDRLVNRFQGSRLGQKVDRFEKGLGRLGTWAPRTIGKGAALAAKGVGRTIGQATGLGDMRRALMGKKNKDGKLVEYGAIHRMASAHGVLDMARKNRLTGGVASAVLDTPLGQAVSRQIRLHDMMKGEKSDELAMKQADERRSLREAVGNSTGEERRLKTLAFYQEHGKIMLDYTEGLRDLDGNIVYHAAYDNDGNAIIKNGQPVMKEVYGYDIDKFKDNKPPRERGLSDGDKIERTVEHLVKDMAGAGGFNKGDASAAAAAAASAIGDELDRTLKRMMDLMMRGMKVEVNSDSGFVTVTNTRERSSSTRERESYFGSREARSEGSRSSGGPKANYSKSEATRGLRDDLLGDLKFGDQGE